MALPMLNVPGMRAAIQDRSKSRSQEDYNKTKVDQVTGCQFVLAVAAELLGVHQNSMGGLRHISALSSAMRRCLLCACSAEAIFWGDAQEYSKLGTCARKIIVSFPPHLMLRCKTDALCSHD
eukprot:2597020-Amphidinium_carterae.1